MSVDGIFSPEDLYKFLRLNGVKIVANIIFAGSPGHQISELDYFLRKFRCGDFARDRKYLWAQRSGAITETMAEVYGEHFGQFNLVMVANEALFEMTSEITRMVPEFGVDVGLSHLKNTVMSRDDTFVARMHDRLYYNVTNERVVRTYMNYYRVRAATADFDPWTPARPPIDGPLADLLGGNTDRIALIHFRKAPGNAGATVPPETLFSSLEYLRDCGFTLVKGGTEPYPEEFSRFGVVNYSQSPLRCFRNDLALLSHSKFALVNASGLENLADVMNIPTVSYARWHLTMVPYSASTVIVPAMLYDPARERLLTFAEQILFFKTRHEFWEGNYFGWHFPVDRFVPRVPQADEMLAAVQEALELAGPNPPPLSPLQARFNQLDESGLLSVAKCRVGGAFLERFGAVV